MRLKEENDRRTDIFLKLRVKQTALKRELSNLNVGKKDYSDDDSNDNKGNKSNKGFGDPDPINQEDLILDIGQNDSFDYENIDPCTLLKERTWDKMIHDKIKELIDK